MAKKPTSKKHKSELKEILSVIGVILSVCAVALVLGATFNQQEAVDQEALAFYQKQITDEIAKDVTDCYKFYGIIARQAPDAGRAIFNIIIAPNGKPLGVKVAESTVRPKLLEIMNMCVNDNVLRREFVEPAFTKKNVVVTIQLTYNKG